MIIWEESSLKNEIIDDIVMISFTWMIAVAACEELFFRGLLLYGAVEWLKWPRLKAALWVSLLFSCAHFVNLSHVDDTLYVLVQVLFAFGAGMLFSSIYFRYGIIWCIIAHALINVTSLLVTETTYPQLLIYAIIAIIMFFVGLLDLRKQEKERHS